jgi:iron(III) transport system ATP-binding protein
VIEPRVLLLDEPLSNLDARLRDEMREEVRRLHAETGLTMVYVTHDQKEALALADRLAVMESGRLVQVGAPLDVYHRPATRFVAGFLGDSNFIPGTVRAVEDGACTVETAVGVLRGVPAKEPPAIGSKVICSIRPAALELTAASGTVLNCIAAEVEQVSFLGELVHLRVLATNKTPLLVASLPHAAGRLKPREAIMLIVPPEQVVLLQE